jgi:hypothetical protein
MKSARLGGTWRTMVFVTVLIEELTANYRLSASPRGVKHYIAITP